MSVASDGSQANWFSYRADVSFDGRVIAFHSFAGNLVDSDTNSEWDVFVREPQQVVFMDGFESGDPSGWSAIVDGG